MNKDKLGISICSAFMACFTLSSTIAAPSGGNIVGGAGNINANGLTTTINQNSSSLAINWNSFDINQNEIVNFVQPGQSSIALNQILGNNATQIHGQINANGHIVLVNSNGLFFGQNATLNVGGLIASGLSVSTQDFMNGDYIFNDVLGTDGTVINQGIINASLGGNVAMIGKQVVNEGMINAKLGSVNLAVGKEAVLTFDQQGLLGVRISKSVLQDELGVDPAVLNEGEINAEGGRVLLTASISRDVFSEAVNHEGIAQATSVIVNEDGSFTLGGGADVANTGSIDVSTKGNNNAGQVVMLGENITHTGSIHADSELRNAGQIELHALNTTELREEAIITAQATQSGSGGEIKILGGNVGLFDSAKVNASGINGGGEILIGGDRQGLNANVRNAEFVYLGEGSNIFADALADGNGGRVITFANNTGRFYGGIYARGGVFGGDGGFIETSGKKGFEINTTPDVSAFVGTGGEWLIDPFDLTIIDTTNPGNPGPSDTTSGFNDTSDPFSAIATGAQIEVFRITDALMSGDVTIKTALTSGDVGIETGNIIFDTDLDYNGTGTNTLTLNADGNITFIGSSSIFDSNNTTADSLSVNLFADGDINMNNAVITTQGGNFTVDGVSGNTPDSFVSSGTINTTGLDDNNGGNISITTSGAITTDALTANGGSSGGNSNGRNAGSITMNAAGLITINGDLQATGSDGLNAGGGVGVETYIGGNGGDVNIESTASTITMAADITNGGGNSDGDNNNNAQGGAGGSVTLTANTGIMTIGNITSNGGTANEDGNGGAGGAIAITATNGNIATGNFNNSGGSSNDDGDGGIGGNITLTGSTGVTFGDLTSDGGDTAEDGTGGTGGVITLTVNTGNIIVDNELSSDGGSSLADNGDGGSGGNINLISLSGGDIEFNNTTTSLSVTAGTGSGTGTDGNHGNINLDGNIVLNDNWSITEVNNFDAGDIDASPASDNNGYNINIVSTGNIDINSITTTGGVAGTNTPGNNGGNITLDSTGPGGTDNGTIVVGAINTNGSAAESTDAASRTGGDAGLVSLVSGGDLTISGISVLGGAGAGGGASGTTQDIAINSPGALNIVGAAPQTITGDNISLSGNSGTLQQSLTMNATGNINWNVGGNDIDYDGIGAVGALAMTANGNVQINGNLVDNSAGGDLLAVTLTSDNDANNTGDITVAGAIDTNGGDTVASGENIDMSDTGNDFATITITAVTNADIADSNDINFNASSATTLTVNAGNNITLNNAANDFTTVNLTGNDVVLQDVGDIEFGTSDISGILTVTANNAGNITQSGEITGGATTSFIATGDDITLTDTDNDFDSVSATGAIVNISDTDNLSLAASSVTDTLTINTDGNITNSGALVVTNATTIDSNNNDITLDNSSNDFSTLLLDGADITVEDVNAIILGTTNANDLDVTANAGTILQSGEIIASGTSSLSAVGNNITLMNTNNNFNTLGLTGASINIVDTNDIDLTTSNITGTLTLDANNITNSGAIVVAGTTILDSNGNNITLNNSGNDFSTVDINGTAQNVELEDANSIILAAATINGTFDVTANGNGTITQSGVLNVTGDTTLTATGNDITLADNANDFNVISLNGDSVTLNDSNGVDLGASMITGDLDLAIIGLGDIDQSGVLTVNGDANFSVNAGQSILLDSFTNNFSGSLSFLANTVGNLDSVSIDNSASLDLASITVDQNLSVIAGGAITNSGALVVGNIAGFDANGNNITLDDPANDFNDLVLANASSANIVDNNSLNIGSSTPGSGFTNTDTMVTGDLAITAGGDITDNNGTAIIVGGTATLNTVGDITLDSPNNDFNNVNFTNVQNASLMDINQVNLQSTSISGDLNVTAGGNIGNAGSLIVNGNTSLNTANASDITLDNSGNALVGNVNLTASSGNLANITLENNVATEISALNVTDDLIITVSGDLTQTGAFTVGDTATFSASGQNITLDMTNSFDRISITTASNATINNGNNDLRLNQLVVDNDLRLDANSLIDNNGNGTNLMADRLTIRTVSGIGNSNELESQVDVMDVINAGLGDIRFDQTGDVEFAALQNANSTGTVEMVSNGDYYFNPGSVDANRSQGTLSMRTNGDFFGVGGFDLNNADITAFSATFVSPTGNFGTPVRPIILDVPTSGSVFIQTITTSVDFFPETPTDLVSEGIDLNILGTVSGIAGDQLVEIESLSEVDPAIFTALRNYSQEEIAIRMPRDQLYDDELESDEAIQ